MRWRHAIERRFRGKALTLPEGLIPAAAGQPLTRGGSAGRRPHQGRRGFLRPDAGEIDGEAGTGKQHEVCVSVDESGQDGASSKITDLFAGGHVDVLPRSSEDDATVAHHQRIDDGAGRVERIESPSGQEHNRHPRTGRMTGQVPNHPT